MKESLIKIAIQNQKEDLEDNSSYWNEVIIDIKNTTTESRILEICQNDFGFDSIEQMLESIHYY